MTIKKIPFIVELRQAIQTKRPLVPILDDLLPAPQGGKSPIISLLKNVIGEEKLKTYIVEGVSNALKDNQDVMNLINSPDGRAYIHQNLDKVLDYLATSPKFAVQYKCPKCSAVFPGKRPNCPTCGILLSWNRGIK